MARVPSTVDDIMASRTRRGLPTPVDYGNATTSEYVQAVDNFHKVFGIRPGDRVLMLTDPLLDVRVTQAVEGLAKARGATFTSYMGESTRYVAVPENVMTRPATPVMVPTSASVTVADTAKAERMAAASRSSYAPRISSLSNDSGTEPWP